MQRHQHGAGHPGQLSVELGRTKVPIKYILQLAQGSVVELDALAGEPMDVLVNGYLIAQGEVVVVNDKFGIRLTDVVTPSERCAGSAGAEFRMLSQTLLLVVLFVVLMAMLPLGIKWMQRRTGGIVPWRARIRGDLGRGRGAAAARGHGRSRARRCADLAGAGRHRAEHQLPVHPAGARHEAARCRSPRGCCLRNLPSMERRMSEPRSWSLRLAVLAGALLLLQGAAWWRRPVAQRARRARLPVLIGSAPAAPATRCRSRRCCSSPRCLPARCMLMMTGFTRIVIVLVAAAPGAGHAVGAAEPGGHRAVAVPHLLRDGADARQGLPGRLPALHHQRDQLRPGPQARGETPVRQFMLKQTRQSDFALFARLAKLDPSVTAETAPIKVLVPAFVTSELKSAFQIGFMIFIPFLVIDIVVASVLMSLGMMMLSPVLVALPFKLMLFVLADGWNLLIGSLAASFAT
jgi:flagellar biosynthetic protein FliP